LPHLCTALHTPHAFSLLHAHFFTRIHLSAFPAHTTRLPAICRRLYTHALPGLDGAYATRTHTGLPSLPLCAFTPPRTPFLFFFCRLCTHAIPAAAGSAAHFIKPRTAHAPVVRTLRALFAFSGFAEPTCSPGSVHTHLFFHAMRIAPHFTLASLYTLPSYGLVAVTHVWFVCAWTRFMLDVTTFTTVCLVLPHGYHTTLRRISAPGFACRATHATTWFFRSPLPTCRWVWFHTPRVHHGWLYTPVVHTRFLFCSLRFTGSRTVHRWRFTTHLARLLALGLSYTLFLPVTGSRFIIFGSPLLRLHAHTHAADTARLRHIPRFALPQLPSAYTLHLHTPHTFSLFCTWTGSATFGPFYTTLTLLAFTVWCHTTPFHYTHYFLPPSRWFYIFYILHFRS